MKKTKGEGQVEFTPRPELVAKLREMITRFMVDNKCTPAEASKFRGLQGFMSLAYFGQLTKAGQRPFIDRQYVHRPPFTLSDSLRRACEFYLAILEDPPKRVMSIRQRERPPVIIASDAQVEPGELPGAGYIVWDLERELPRGAWYQHEDADLERLRTSMAQIAEGSQPIAKCECAVLPTALYHEADWLRGRDIVWFVDNTVALSGLVKGTSREPVNEKLIAHFWVAAFRLDARIWLEYVDSKSNWADGISREFDKDLLVIEHRVETRRIVDPFHWMCESPTQMWEQSKRLGA